VAVWAWGQLLRRRREEAAKAAADTELAPIRARIAELELEAVEKAAEVTKAVAAAEAEKAAAAAAGEAEKAAAAADARVERLEAEAAAAAAVEAAYGRGVLVGMKARGASGSLPADLEGLRMRVPSSGVGPGGRGAVRSPTPGLTGTLREVEGTEEDERA
jgi:hypothetical protein